MYAWCLYVGPLQVRRFVSDRHAALARMRAARQNENMAAEKSTKA
jgi:hypothetical protein